MRAVRKMMAIAFVALVLFGCGGDWRTASREPLGLVPDPAFTPEAVLHVYGADAWSCRSRR